MHLLSQIPSWVPDLKFSSSQLMVLGGALLFFAGVLLGLRKSRTVRLQRSPLTDELTIYLSRIADALERNTPPSTDQIIQEIQRRINNKERGGEPNGPKVHPVSFSTFGREYLEK